MALLLFTVPFGILHNFPLANLSGTWSSWYDANYSDQTTSFDVTPNQGECILMGSKMGEAAATLSLAAFGRRDVIEGATGVQENGVYWYREPARAVGLAPSDVVDLDPADMADPRDTMRLSWQLDTGVGGYRSGATVGLNDNNDWRKVMMYGPCVVEDIDDDDVEEVAALLVHPALLLALALVLSGLVFVPSCVAQCGSSIHPVCDNVPAVAPPAPYAASTLRRWVPREDSSGSRYGYYFALEFFGLVSGSGTLYTAYALGELEYANDEYDLLFWGLLVSNVFSCFRTIITFAALRSHNWPEEVHVGGRGVKIIPTLILLHLVCADNFQMWIYAGIVASAWANGGEFIVSLIAIGFSIAFIGVRAYEYRTF